jgi:hypothetical protein
MLATSLKRIAEIMKTFNYSLKEIIFVVLIANSLMLTACSKASVLNADLVAIESLESISESEIKFNDGQLDQMLAPIALYPDSLLTHILIAATYPLEVVMAGQFHANNKQLANQEFFKKAETMGWDPSVVALLAFPSVLDKLNNDLRWTQDLGDAFLEDEARLLASIQSLRAQALSADSLANLENMAVTQEQNQIVIEPIQPEVVYVPYYDPRVVYGHWRWHNYPPVYWAPAYGYTVRPHGYFHWSRGVRISSNFFFSAFHWTDYRIVVIDHHHSRRYLPRVHITHDHNARGWHHKSHHRRGVAYSNVHVKKRYKSYKSAKRYSRENNTERYLSNRQVRSRPGAEKHFTDKSKRLQNTNKAVKLKREALFAKRLRNSQEQLTKQPSMASKEYQAESTRRSVDKEQQKHRPKQDRVQKQIASKQKVVSQRNKRQLLSNRQVRSRPGAEKNFTDKNKRLQNINKAVKQKREELFAKRLRNSQEPLTKQLPMASKEYQAESKRRRVDKEQQKHRPKQDRVQKQIASKQKVVSQRNKRRLFSDPELAKVGKKVSNFNKPQQSYASNHKEAIKKSKNSEASGKRTKPQRSSAEKKVAHSSSLRLRDGSKRGDRR